MLDREVFSCIPFQLVLSQICLSLSFVRNNFSLFAKNFFWNWSLNSAVKILLPRTISFVYRLYLFCNICQKYFLTVSSSSDPFKPIQLVFCFYRMYVTAYLLCTHRIVTFCYVAVRKHVRKHFWEKRSSVKYSGELWCRVLNESIPGFYDVVANVIIVITLWLRTFWQCSHFLKLMP